MGTRYLKWFNRGWKVSTLSPAAIMDCIKWYLLLVIQSICPSTMEITGYELWAYDTSNYSTWQVTDINNNTGLRPYYPGIVLIALQVRTSIQYSLVTPFISVPPLLLMWIPDEMWARHFQSINMEGYQTSILVHQHLQLILCSFSLTIQSFWICLMDRIAIMAMIVDMNYGRFSQQAIFPTALTKHDRCHRCNLLVFRDLNIDSSTHNYDPSLQQATQLQYHRRHCENDLPDRLVWLSSSTSNSHRA